MTRAAWAPQTQERGLVYREAGQCILVPTVCRNVSRITRAEVGNERAEADPFMPTPLSTDPPALAAADIDTAAPAEPFAIDALPSFGNTCAGAAIGGLGGSGGMGASVPWRSPGWPPVARPARRRRTPGMRRPAPRRRRKR